MGGLAESRTGHIQVDEMNGFPDQDQAELIAKHYASVSNDYKALEKSDIPGHLYETTEKCPRIQPYQMHQRIEKMLKCLKSNC